MNSNKLFTSVVGLALMVTPALARAVPIISGKYATSYNQTCQAIQSNLIPGSSLVSVSITDFNSDTGMLHAAGFLVTGALVDWTGGNEGMTRQALSLADEPYSNDATTATFNGVTYDAVYGPVKNGIAQSVLLSGIPWNVSADCGASIVLIRQH